MCSKARQLIKNESHGGKSPQEDKDIPLRARSIFVMACRQLSSYLDLTFPHDFVHNLVVVLVEHAFVVTLLVAKNPQVLGAFQFDLKLLCSDTEAVRDNYIDAFAQ